MMEKAGDKTTQGDESTAEGHGQMADMQTHITQLETLVQQTSGHLMTLVKSMTESVAALQDTPAPGQQNHLFVLETQISYLQRLACTLATAVEQQPPNDIK